MSDQSSPSLWQVIKSVLASAFGVQSDTNYERDFSHNSIVPYVLVGIVFVVLLVLGLIGVVSTL
jgi:hypothetical protein